MLEQHLQARALYKTALRLAMPVKSTHNIQLSVSKASQHALARARPKAGRSNSTFSREQNYLPPNQQQPWIALSQALQSCK